MDFYGIMLKYVELCEIGWILWNFSESIQIYWGYLQRGAHRDTVTVNTFVLMTHPDSKLLSRREMGKTELTNLLNPLSHFTSSLSGEVSENDCDQ